MTDVIDVDEAEATDISTPVLEAPGLRRRRRSSVTVLGRPGTGTTCWNCTLEDGLMRCSQTSN